MASFWLLKGFSNHVSQVQSNMLHYVSWAKFICKCHSTVSAHVRIVHNVQFKLPSTVKWTKWQCLPVGVTFLWLLFQFLCFVTGFWVLYLFQSRYARFTRVRKFHNSLTLGDFFSITSQTFVKAVLCDSSRSSCPLLFSSFALHQWVGLLWYCLRQLAVKTCFTCKKKSKPRILRKSFSSLLFSTVSSTDIQTL